MGLSEASAVSLALISLLFTGTAAHSVQQGRLTEGLWIVAHRGASGLMPEHTLGAYKLAIEQVSGVQLLELVAATLNSLALLWSVSELKRLPKLFNHILIKAGHDVQGADFIECDVVLTKDCKPICRHEPDISQTTDAMLKFPYRERNVTIDGQTHEVRFQHVCPVLF